MYGLPTSLKIRFKLYLHILPTFQTCLMYGFSIFTVFAFCYSIRKFLLSRRPATNDQSPWIEDDLVLNIDRKLSSYIPEKRSSLTPRELEEYFTSLVKPLNQVIEDGCEEQLL